MCYFIFFSNYSFGQNATELGDKVIIKKYEYPVSSSNNATAKVFATKQQMVDKLKQRLVAINENTTLSAERKQELIALTEARLAKIENP